MKFTPLVRGLPLLAALLALAACADVPNPAAPDAGTAGRQDALLALTCVASTRTQSVSCGSPSTGGARAVIVGGQNLYVRLASSNIQVAADTFAFDVTVQNLIPQSLGTTDGTTLDPAGVRVFFQSDPVVTGGSGTVTVANEDGTSTFTASAQPYFQYNTLLARDSTSAPRRWKLQFTPQVTTFSFTLYVSAAVQFPDGYVDGTPYVLTLNPNEAAQLPAVVRTFVGNAVPGATVSWTSNAPATAAVSGTTVTAGSGRGFAELTATSGVRPGVYTTAVSVCPATTVANGTNLPASIASTDCFSSYGSNNGRPTTSYYGDLYRVQLTAGQTLTVTMDSGENLDTYLLLAGPSLGFLVAGNDDDPDGVLGIGSRMVYTATATGVYVIEASTFNNLDTGNYTLGVTIS